MADIGRPTDYREEFCDIARQACERGATDDELADLLEVHRATIYRWKIEHADFCDAIKAGKEIADNRVVRSLYQKATGYDYVEEQAIKVKRGQHEEEVEVVEVRKHAPAETQAGMFWLKNRQPEQWRDKQELEHKGSITIERVSF